MCARERRTSTITQSPPRRLRRKSEVDDVAVQHDIVLAFEPDFTMIAARGHRPARHQRIVADDFRANESTGDVTVDLARRQLRRGASWDRPGSAFVLAHGEERNIPEQVVAGSNHAIEPRL